LLVAQTKDERPTTTIDFVLALSSLVITGNGFPPTWTSRIYLRDWRIRYSALGGRKSMTRKRRRRRPASPLPQYLPPAANPQLAAAILEIVDTQLRDRTPPETLETFERLIGLGYMPEGARQLLAHVVVREIFTVMSRGEKYDATRFVAALRRLPALPEDTSGE
jgi:hypothetical protein